MLILGDSLEKLKDLKENSIDAVVTDPPYGLAFMGKKWDYDVPSVELWREVFRVLKHGGHLLSFGGTRTYHRMVVNIEDAGFEIRDQIQWLYGSGFPKSHNIGKAIDKMQGSEREVVGVADVGPDFTGNNFHRDSGERKITNITKGNSVWEGWGTALKPANEPIVLARKPIEKGLTIAENVLKYGVGGLNIDESRNAQGRFPSNLILDEVAAEMLDEQSGDRIRLADPMKKLSNFNFDVGGKHTGQRFTPYTCTYGGASRFFYVAKSSKKDRNTNGANNIHPTCKPTKLMEYLIKLVTPQKGKVLDPFMGSGTTGVACKNLGFEFVGIEREEQYLEIARKRIEHSFPTR